MIKDKLIDIKRKLNIELRHLRVHNNESALNITNIIADLGDVIEQLENTSDNTNIKYDRFQPCKHKGCLSHISHPCEGCGRIAGDGIIYRPSAGS